MVEITRLPEEARFSFRIAVGGVAAASKAFGVDLPTTIGGMAANGSRRALCLGPDEWQLDTSASERDAVVSAFAGIYAAAPHSLVEVTDREFTYQISGEQAEELLTVGVPRDMALVTVGSGTRTLFDTVPAILVREADNRFTLSVWRSFAPHAEELLHIANKEFAAGL